MKQTETFTFNLLFVPHRWQCQLQFQGL